MKIITQCECNKPYPNPDHGETCMKCGEEILEKGDEKMDYDHAMEEMECWSVQNHLKKCKKCVYQAKQEGIERVGIIVNAISLECMEEDIWDIKTLDEVRKRIFELKKKEENMIELKFKKELWWTIPDGWEDLGKVNSSAIEDGTIMTEAHVFCLTIPHVGKTDKGELFKFCPKCLIKLKGEELKVAYFN